ncbi:amino acid permease [Pseudonocardia xinjiangensis]|uniref:amino acid permease n=1 Tax=Pseudonocardia xinjiangensis TaxID=75289 RepID=UPI003D9342B3
MTATTGHQLHRRLTARQLTMIGLGGAIGTGLFLGSALAISQAGPATIIAFVVVALVALVIAWALAEMVTVHPTAGAFGTIAHAYLGRWAGFVIRWTYWTIQVIAVGGEVIAAGIYVQYWWPSIPLWLAVVVFSVALIVVNAATVRLFGEFEYWLSMIKVSAIVVFIVLGILLITVGLPDAPATGLSNLTSDGGFFPMGLGGVFLAMVFVVFSFVGTEVVSVTAAEAENPARDVPRAARQMVLRLALFYVLAIAVVLTIAPWSQTAKGGSLDASPFVRVLEAAQVPAGASVMNFVILTAALSSANTNLYLTTRMLHSLAGHGYAPAALGRLSRSGAPRNALALSTIGLAVAAALSVNDGTAAYLALFGISVFGALVVWMMILASHARFRLLRRRHGLPDSPARIWGAPVTTGLAFLFLGAVLVSTAFIDGLQIAWKVGVPFFALLLVAYLVTASRGRGDAGSDPLRDELAQSAAPVARLDGA